MRNVSYFKYENGQRVDLFNIDKEAAEKAYKDFVSRNIREFDLRVYIGGRMLNPSDIVSIRVNSDLFTTDSFTIGAVVAETLELTIYTDTSFGRDDIGYLEEYVINKKSPIVPFVVLRTEVEVQTEHGYELQEVWQDVNLGPFYINPDGISEDGLGIMSIRASSLFTHPEFSNKYIDWGANKSDRTLKQLIETVQGNDWYFNNYNNNPRFSLLNDDLPDITVKFDNIKDMSLREMIEYVAKLYGGYARTVFIVDEKQSGKTYLEFFKKQQTDYVYDESSYVFLTRGGAGSGLKVTKIKCGIDDKNTITVGSGTDTNHTVYMSCSDMTKDRLTEILSDFTGYSFRPTTTKIFGNPMLQVGDIVTVYGRGIHSGGDELPLHSVVYNITGSGITMDVKSLFKLAEVTKKVIDDESGKEDEDKKFKETTQQSLDELYDRTTIQYEDKDKNLPLITLKEDYLETKDSLMDDIEGLGGSYTSLSTQITNHINDKTAHSAGDIDLNSLTLQQLNFEVPGDTSAGHYAQLTAVRVGAGRGLKLYAASAMKFTINSRSCMTLDDDFLRIDDMQGISMGNNKVIYMNNGVIQGTVVETDDGFSAVRWTAKDMIAHFSTLNYCKITGSLNANGCEIYNVGNFEYASLDAQSEYTELLVECDTNENKTYGNKSYDSNELRWCWKETVFTYAESDIDPETDEWTYTGRYICYIELPIFMAENIEDDYHINVSKMSWGDYRIIEKTPYYFILESQEDNFAFTFEVVAKLTDNDNQ